MTQQAPGSSTSPEPEVPGQESPAPVAKPDTSGITRRGLFRRAAIGAASLGTLGGLVLPSGVAAAASPAGITPVSIVPASQSHAALSTPASVEFPRGGQLREYWFQVDAFFHNIMPSGMDGMTGNTVKASDTSFWALGYRAFTPGWGEPLPGSSDIGANSGIPGPIIRAQVGDHIRLHLKNNDTYYKQSHTLSIHALRFAVESDGAWAWMLRDRPGTTINPGDSYTYDWDAVPRSVGTWPYHDHSKHFDPGRGSVVMEAGAALGLIGMLAVTDSNTPTVDNEIATVWNSFYQGDIPGISQDYHCFDGTAYLTNTPTIRTKVGQSIRWRILSLGNDFHTFHMHGHSWQMANGFTDAFVMGPGVGSTIEYVEDALPGAWYYHCHVTTHVMGPGMGGMIGLNVVEA